MSEGLVVLWARVRLAILRCADGATASLEGKVTGDREPPPGPRQAGSEIAVLEARWNGCKSDDARRAVLRDAITTLHHMRYAPPSRMRRGTKEWKAAIALDSRGATVVAEAYAVSRQTVYDFRKQYRDAA